MIKNHSLAVSIFLVFISMMIMTSAVEMPQFKSGLSTKAGVDVDFDALYSKANAIYDVVEHDNSHIIWKFSQTTGDWAFANKDGNLIIASKAGFNLAVKDVLGKEYSDMISTMKAAGGTISGADPIIFYMEDDRIFRMINYNFDKDFKLYLSVPNCTVSQTRLSVSGGDWAELYSLGAGVKTNGQWYKIDGKWVSGCDLGYSDEKTSGTSCGSAYGVINYGLSGYVTVSPVDVTNYISPGLHTIEAASIANEHTMTIDTITTPTDKPIVLYSEDKTVWVEDIKRSKSLNDLYSLIQPTSTIAGSTTSPIGNNILPGDTIGIDPTDVLRGLQSVCAAGVPGPIEVTNDKAIPIVSGDEDTNPKYATVAVASSLGNGRVIALGHDGFFINEAIDLFDNRAFGDNMVDWLDKTTAKKKILVTTGHSEWWVDTDRLDKFYEELRGRGYTIEKYPGTITSSELSDVSVVLINSAWSDFSEAEIDAIKNYVLNGGGLFLWGLGWSWVQYKGSIDSYPMNKMASPFGIQWLDGYISDPSNSYQQQPVFHVIYPDTTKDV